MSKSKIGTANCKTSVLVGFNLFTEKSYCCDLFEKNWRECLDWGYKQHSTGRPTEENPMHIEKYAIWNDHSLNSVRIMCCPWCGEEMLPEIEVNNENQSN